MDRPPQLPPANPSAADNQQGAEAADDVIIADLPALPAVADANDLPQDDAPEQEGASDNRSGLFTVDFGASPEEFAANMNMICSGVEGNLGFDPEYVNIYETHRRDSEDGLKLNYSISILMRSSGKRRYYGTRSLLAGMRKAIEMGYVLGEVNLAPLIDGEFIQIARDIGYPENVAMTQQNKSAIVILHLNLCWKARSHFDMCEKLGISIGSLTSPTHLQRIISAGELGLPITSGDAWTYPKQNKCRVPLSIAGALRGKHMPESAAREVALIVPNQLFRDLAWSIIEMHNSLEEESCSLRESFIAEIKTLTAVLSEETGSWNSWSNSILHRCFERGALMKLSTAKVLMEHWHGIYGEGIIDDPKVAAFMFLLFRRTRVGDTVSQDEKDALVNEGIITETYLCVNDEDQPVGIKRTRSSSSKTYSIAFLPTEDCFGEYVDESADVKRGTVLLVQIDGQWTLLYYGGVGEDEEGNPIVYLQNVDPTHGEEKKGRFVYQYKKRHPANVKKSYYSFDDVMSCLRNELKEDNLYVDTDDEGKCTNLFIFKKCGDLPIFWNESDELTDLKKRLERVKSEFGQVDWSELDEEQRAEL